VTLKLSPATSRLIEKRMKKGGYPDRDALVRFALKTLEQVEGDTIEQLDEESQAALMRAEAQFERGEGRPWSEVKAELRARFKR